jgi:hypothetical protein
MNPLSIMLDWSSWAFSAAEAAFQPPAAGAAWPSTPFTGDPMATMLAAMTRMASAMIELVPQPDPARVSIPHRPGASNGSAELRELMIRAFIATAGSSLRYWRTLAELYARKANLLQLQTARAFGELPPSQAERVLLDELRGFFRELAEVGITEAARLSAELEQIGGALLEVAGATEPSGPYQRRWKAKD